MLMRPDEEHAKQIRALRLAADKAYADGAWNGLFVGFFIGAVLGIILMMAFTAYA
jgi:hypothetical protein